MNRAASAPAAARQHRWKHHLGQALFAAYGVLGYAFFYLPILILFIFSFNDSRSVSKWAGFTLRWYEAMLQDHQIMVALWNSVFVAVVSMAIATVLGTMAAMALERYRRFPGRLIADITLYLPIIIPDIAMAIMLLAFFKLSGIGFQTWKVHIGGLRLAVPYSVIIGHVAFNISFVAVVVQARLAQMDRSLEEAAQDLYATPWRTFWRVTLPLMMPGVLGGALLAFTLSLDDFIITFFTSGAGFNTLPVRVFGMIRKGVTPKINAVSSLMLGFSLLLVTFALLATRRRDEQRAHFF